MMTAHWNNEDNWVTLAQRSTSISSPTPNPVVPKSERAKAFRFSSSSSTISLLLFFVFALITPFRPSMANSWNAGFFSDTNTLVVVVQGVKHHQNLLDSFGQQFPVSNEDLELAITEVLKKKIVVPKEYEVLSTNEFRQHKDYSTKDPDKIFLQVRLTYWPKARFSPQIDHDIVMITGAYKRNTRNGNPGEYDISPLLVSLPSNDPKELQTTLRNVFDSLFDTELVPYLNCANGGSCHGVP